MHSAGSHVKAQNVVPHLNLHIPPYRSCAQLETPLDIALCTCGSAREQNVTCALASMYWGSKQFGLGRLDEGCCDRWKVCVEASCTCWEA